MLFFKRIKMLQRWNSAPKCALKNEREKREKKGETSTGVHEIMLEIL